MPKPHTNRSKVKASIGGNEVEFALQTDGIRVHIKYARDEQKVPLTQIFSAACMVGKTTLTNPTAIELDVVREDLAIIIATLESTQKLDAGQVEDAIAQLKKAQKILKS